MTLTPRAKEAARKCTVCQSTKPLSDFYARTWRCKVCDNEKRKERRRHNPAQHAVVASKWRRKNRAAVMAITKRWQRKHPETWKTIRRARRVVYKAVRQGKLVRPDRCENCDREGAI